MIPAIAEKLEGKILRETVFVRKDDFEGEICFTTADGHYNPKTGVTKKPIVLVTVYVPFGIQMYVANEIMRTKKYEKPTFLFADSQQY